MYIPLHLPQRACQVSMAQLWTSGSRPTQKSWFFNKLLVHFNVRKPVVPQSNSATHLPIYWSCNTSTKPWNYTYTKSSCYTSTNHPATYTCTKSSYYTSTKPWSYTNVFQIIILHIYQIIKLPIYQSTTSTNLPHLPIYHIYQSTTSTYLPHLPIYHIYRSTTSTDLPYLPILHIYHLQNHQATHLPNHPTTYLLNYPSKSNSNKWWRISSWWIPTHMYCKGCKIARTSIFDVCMQKKHFQLTLLDWFVSSFFRCLQGSILYL
jgi:hypothetical protein